MAYIFTVGDSLISFPNDSTLCLHERAGDHYRMAIPVADVLEDDKICRGGHEYIFTVDAIEVA